ncbi:helix-turn-helix transcriptional regulator [Ferruginibacter profundus]
MQIFHLPEDIFGGGEQSSNGILFYNYAAPLGSFKGKSILSKNAISLVLSGEKTMHFAAKTVKVNPGEFHFLSAGNCIVSMKLDESIQFKSILLFFDNAVLQKFYSKYHDLVAAFTGKQKLSSEPYLAFKKDAFVVHFIESLQLLFKQKTPVSPEMKQLKFEELMLHLLERYPDKILAFQHEKQTGFDDMAIRRAVETNITNNLALEELAFLCNTSVSTFKRRFVKIYGTSPNKWILQQRMELAKDLLLHHNEKPGEVFYKVGYENHSSFTQSFKQTFGTTPKAFQLQHLNFQQ